MLLFREYCIQRDITLVIPLNCYSVSRALLLYTKRIQGVLGTDLIVVEDLFTPISTPQQMTIMYLLSR